VAEQSFTDWISFLSPNQQHQSTEEWQCSWLGTACYHHAAKTGQEHCDSCVGCLALWPDFNLYSYSDSSI